MDDSASASVQEINLHANLFRITRYFSSSLIAVPLQLKQVNVSATWITRTMTIHDPQNFVNPDEKVIASRAEIKGYERAVRCASTMTPSSNAQVPTLFGLWCLL